MYVHEQRGSSRLTEVVSLSASHINSTIGVRSEIVCGTGRALADVVLMHTAHALWRIRCGGLRAITHPIRKNYLPRTEECLLLLHKT